MSTNDRSPDANGTGCEQLLHGRLVPLLVCASALGLCPIIQAQMNYSISCANQTNCDIKMSAFVDVTGNNCGSPTLAGSQFLSTGTTTTFSFTIPSGYEFCYYLMTQQPNSGGPYLQTSGGDPCAWNFTGVDLCNDGPPNVSGKGNCTSARFSQ
ncbi:MAG TPA: hypothetical protein P5291_10070 [Flavobacteriales bacterium]|nr:hypothetical protein [Flavobacteriales bacterium]